MAARANPWAASRPPVLWGHRGIAEYLNTTPKTVEHLIERAGLPAFKVRSRVASRPEDIDAWLERQAQATANVR